MTPDTPHRSEKVKASSAKPSSNASSSAYGAGKRGQGPAGWLGRESGAEGGVCVRRRGAVVCVAV